jgi:SMI1-KNR4 cell-wall
MAISVPIELLSPEQRLEPTNEMISKLERTLGFQLPSDYQLFLAQHGGSLLGDLDHDVVIPLLEPCPLGEVAYPEVILGFYLNPDDPYDVRSAAEVYRGRIPTHAVGIAYSLGGDLVVLSCTGPDRGCVYLWDHEYRAEGGVEFEQRVLRELENQAIDAGSLDAEQALMKWEQLHVGQSLHPAGYRMLYLLARSFEDFLKSLTSVPVDARETD